MKKTPLKDVLQELGLPEDTDFIGYGIHLAESDEFLLTCDEREGVQNIGWSKTPELCKVFQSIKKAEKIKNKFKPEANIVWMFDIGKQIFIAQPEGYGNLSKATRH